MRHAYAALWMCHHAQKQMLRAAIPGIIPQTIFRNCCLPQCMALAALVIIVPHSFNLFQSLSLGLGNCGIYGA